MAEWYEPSETASMIDQLGICGCGIPQETYQAIYEMLVRASESKSLIDLDDPYMYFMAYRLDQMELIEHGTSIRFSWLTEKGKKMLNALSVFKKYEFDYARVNDEMPDDMWVLRRDEDEKSE